jgi:hypothetical protein
MSKRLAIAFLIAFLLYGVVAATLVTRTILVKEDFYSPAATSRGVYGFQDGDIGLLKKTPHKTDIVFPAREVMTGPRFIDGETAKDIVLDWSTSPEMAPDGKKDRWRETLQGDDKVELVAFASWVPSPDDPLTNEGGWEAALSFRDPATLEIISGERLRDLGVPESFSRLAPPRRFQTPVIRLLFRTSGIEYPHCVGINIGDQRTGARVSYELASSNDGPSRDEFAGAWLRVDTELLIWHDSPIDCRVRFLTGEPQVAQLPQQRGAQVAFGEDLRVQWLAAMERDPQFSGMDDAFKPAASSAGEHEALMKRLRADSFKSRNRVMNIDFDPTDEIKPGTLVRASSPDFLEEHCGLITREGILWNWSGEKTSKDLFLASIASAPAREESLQLVFLPYLAELSYSIAGLPDMPNPRGIEDLFDATLPRISLPEDIEDAESHLLGFIGVGAQIAWESNGLWDNSMQSRLPPDRTFRNETPQSLLNWYLDNTPGAYVRYDQAGLVIHINEEKPDWREKLDELIQKVSLIFF